MVVSNGNITDNCVTRRVNTKHRKDQETNNTEVFIKGKPNHSINSCDSSISTNGGHGGSSSSHVVVSNRNITDNCETRKVKTKHRTDQETNNTEGLIKGEPNHSSSSSSSSSSGGGGGGSSHVVVSNKYDR